MKPITSCDILSGFDIKLVLFFLFFLGLLPNHSFGNTRVCSIARNVFKGCNFGLFSQRFKSLFASRMCLLSFRSKYPSDHLLYPAENVNFWVRRNCGCLVPVPLNENKLVLLIHSSDISLQRRITRVGHSTMTDSNSEMMEQSKMNEPRNAEGAHSHTQQTHMRTFKTLCCFCSSIHVKCDMMPTKLLNMLLYTVEIHYS